jgi:hypothetical protein
MLVPSADTANPARGFRKSIDRSPWQEDARRCQCWPPSRVASRACAPTQPCSASMKSSPRRPAAGLVWYCVHQCWPPSRVAKIRSLPSTQPIDAETNRTPTRLRVTAPRGSDGQPRARAGGSLDPPTTAGVGATAIVDGETAGVVVRPSGATCEPETHAAMASPAAHSNDAPRACAPIPPRRDTRLIRCNNTCFAPSCRHQQVRGVTVRSWARWQPLCGACRMAHDGLPSPLDAASSC